MFAIAPAPSHQRTVSGTTQGRSSSQTTHTSGPAVDPEATHYQDPEARKKLRTYLASPQKFDEAIEFGFPSVSAEEDATPTPHYQLPPITSHSRTFSRDMQVFLKDGKLSFLHDGGSENQGLDSDNDSATDPESPTTPSSTGLSFRLHAQRLPPGKMSIESHGLPPANLNREMTLRMTLTRPDLRADDDQLYGWQTSPPQTTRDDPLALEELVLTDDMTGTKGAFYVKPKARNSFMSRILKRASMMNR